MLHTSSRSYLYFMQPEVHYRAHKSPRLFPVLSHTDPVHSLPCYFFNILFNIILSSMPTVSSMWAVYFDFLNQNHVWSCSLTCHMPCPSNSPWSDHLNDVWCRLQTTKLLITRYSPVSCPFPPLFLSTCSRTPSACALSSLSETKFHTHVKQKAVL